MTHKTKSDYLDNSPPISLHPPLARVFGVNAALIIQQIRYWMGNYQLAEQSRPEDQRYHWHDDRWWVYNTYEQWHRDNFDFWSKRTIQRHINELENKGVLISGEFNKSSGDRTKWYTINFDVLDQLVSENEGTLNPSSQSVQTIVTDCPDHLDKVARSIYIDTETTTETTNSTGAKSAPVPQPEKPKRKRSEKQLALDAMKNALADAFGLDHDKVTGTKWNEFGKAGSELIAVGATPDEMKALHTWCKKQDWPTFTSMAMAKSYADWRKERQQSALIIQASTPPTDEECNASIRELTGVSA
jgi:hypothetical protein